jgi:hypothetical protein
MNVHKGYKRFKNNGKKKYIVIVRIMDINDTIEVPFTGTYSQLKIFMHRQILGPGRELVDFNQVKDEEKK